MQVGIPYPNSKDVQVGTSPKKTSVLSYQINFNIDNYCPKKTTDPFSLTAELLFEGEIKNVEVEYDVILLFKLTTIYYLSSKMCPNAFFPFTKSVLQTTFVAKNYIIPCQKSPPKILNTSPTCVQNKMMCYCVFYNSCLNAGEV